MTFFRSLGARRFALLAVVFVIGVACAKVDRGYYDEEALGGAGSGAGSGGGGGKAGSGTAGKSSGGSRSDAGAAGDGDFAGAAGESAAGAAGATGEPLTIELAGDGTGVVTSDPPAIQCSNGTCSGDLDPDTEVVLTATPAANSTFAGWAGGGCSGTGTCTTVISEATLVKATFTLKPTLTVKLAGTGVGVVKSIPSGIDCGTTCSLVVAPDSSIQLTATPATGSLFAGWSGGGCTGTGTCSTTVAAATGVTATFTLIPETLTVLKAGTGLGTVTSAPAGINCGTECNKSYDYGSVVTLTAAATVGTVFSGWTGGGCSGTGTCVVTLTAATQVTASFTCSAGSLTLNYTGAITTFAVPSCVTSLTIDAYGAQGGTAGTYLGGGGARIKGTMAVASGLTLKVLVGGKGLDAIDANQQAGGSGGGGTFVTNSANSPLVVAGGGGGAINYSGLYVGAGLGGGITTAGLADSSGTDAGGVNGNGGVSGPNAGYHAGTGGGGLLGDGVNNSMGDPSTYGTPLTPGLAFVHGGTGGLANSCAAVTTGGCIVGRPGGFGGGGAAGFSGGGGGGYSGGGGGHYSGTMATVFGAGGGGGSYLLAGATAPTAVPGTRVGNGMVVFTY